MIIYMMRKKLVELARCASGNTTLLVALGMPVVLGGSGLAVDTAQLYMFKRELQLAADQGAIAGAWARAGGDTGTQYQTRAGQEFDGNLSTIAEFSPSDTATLANYDGGTANSVVVVASMQVQLPFVGIFLSEPTTVSVRAQAIWEHNSEYTACLMALHKTVGKALWFNGGPTVDAACGVASMSEAADSISTNGSSGPQNINTAVAAGRIRDGMNAFQNSETRENYDGLEDPYEDLVPPDNPTPRGLSCGSSTVTWTADETTTSTLSYKYYKGKNKNAAKSAGEIAYAGSSPTETTTTIETGQSYTSEPVGSTAPPNVIDMYRVEGKGPDQVFEEVTETVTTSYANKSSHGGEASTQLPGTYPDFTIDCDTTLAGGVYVIDGGKFKLNGGNKLTGTGVMFVLKNGAQLDINGTAETYLTPMTIGQMIAAGISPENAARMKNMLIFEDPESEGRSDSKVNGTADLDINGIIYMPKSNLNLLGTMQSSAECLMILASTLQIGGTADLATFCPPGKTHDVVVGGGDTRVRLVA